jgi:hypothetical protein
MRSIDAVAAEGVKIGRAGGRLAIVLAAASTLATASAFAAGGTKAPPKLTVGAHYWEVSVGGRSYKVPDAGRIVYCRTAKVETITPIVHLTASKAAPNFYAFRVTAPKGQGRTSAVEEHFSGRGTVLNIPITPSGLRKLGLLSADGNRALFPPGTYTLGVFQHPVPVEGSVKPLLLQHITLAPKASC